ncbi:hypothetical protein JXA85_06175 [Candidatus Woesearchaeota archaeon]|nr:hypothetical protein [Candidatus Woesearchaeota archaeon]
MMRSQSSFEFIVIFTIAFLVFISFVSVTESRFTGHQDSMTQEHLQILANTIQDYFRLVNESQFNMVMEVNIPTTIDGKEYDMQADSNTLIIRDPEMGYSAYADIPSIMKYDIRKGCNKIIKDKNGVTIEEC